jgi:hypothetical protein
MELIPIEVISIISQMVPGTLVLTCKAFASVRKNIFELRNMIQDEFVGVKHREWNHMKFYVKFENKVSLEENDKFVLIYLSTELFIFNNRLTYEIRKSSNLSEIGQLFIWENTSEGQLVSNSLIESFASRFLPNCTLCL